MTVSIKKWTFRLECPFFNIECAAAALKENLKALVVYYNSLIFIFWNQTSSP